LNWLKYLNTFKKNEAIEKVIRMDGMGILLKTETDLQMVQRVKLN